MMVIAAIAKAVHSIKKYYEYEIDSINGFNQIGVISVDTDCFTSLTQEIDKDAIALRFKIAITNCSLSENDEFLMNPMYEISEDFILIVPTNTMKIDIPDIEPDGVSIYDIEGAMETLNNTDSFKVVYMSGFIPLIENKETKDIIDDINLGTQEEPDWI